MGSGGGRGSSSSNWTSEWWKPKNPSFEKGRVNQFHFLTINKVLIADLKIKGSKHMLREAHLMFSLDISPCCLQSMALTHYPQHLWWGVAGAGHWYQDTAAPFLVLLLFPYSGVSTGVALLSTILWTCSSSQVSLPVLGELLCLSVSPAPAPFLVLSSPALVFSLSWHYLLYLRAGQVRRNHSGSSGPTSLLRNGHPRAEPQDCVWVVLEYLQRGRLHSFAGQSVPVHGEVLWSLSRVSCCLSFRCLLPISVSVFLQKFSVLFWFCFDMPWASFAIY